MGRENAGAVLRVENLHVVYDGGNVALRGVSLSVAPGEIVALLGSNGAGKTTSLSAVAGLLAARRGAPSQGSATYGDLDLLKAPPRAIVGAGVASVLEGRRIFAPLTVEENLVAGAMGARLSAREARRGVEQAYALFPRLAERRHTAAGLGSGGEQQMLAIARALIAQPRLLVLDEPSMGLAPLAVRGIFRILKRLNAEQGLAILVAEQNSAIALSVAHRAVVLENGASALTDTAERLRASDSIAALYLGRSVTRAA